MNQPAFSWNSNRSRRGTLFARFTSVIVAASTAALSASGYSGCLLGTRTIPDNADVQAVYPVTVTSATPALDTIITEESAVHVDGQYHIDIEFSTDFPDRMEWTAYLNRPRDPSVCGDASTCGFLVSEGARVAVDPPSPRQIHLTVSDTYVQQAGNCASLDIFIAIDFQTGIPSVLTTPLRGDVTVLHWYIAHRRAATDPDGGGTYPTVDTCRQ